MQINIILIILILVVGIFLVIQCCNQKNDYEHMVGTPSLAPQISANGVDLLQRIMTNPNPQTDFIFGFSNINAGGNVNFNINLPSLEKYQNVLIYFTNITARGPISISCGTQSSHIGSEQLPAQSQNTALSTDVQNSIIAATNGQKKNSSHQYFQNFAIAKDMNLNIDLTPNTMNNTLDYVFMISNVKVGGKINLRIIANPTNVTAFCLRSDKNNNTILQPGSCEFLPKNNKYTGPSSTLYLPSSSSNN